MNLRIMATILLSTAVRRIGILSLFALVCGIVFSNAGHAATLVGGIVNPTGINGLIVDGTAYDVEFVVGPYQSIYSSAEPLFLNNHTGAEDAANAISDLFNASGVTVTAPFGVAVVVPYQLITDAALVWEAGGGGFWSPAWSTNSNALNLMADDIWANFTTVSPVPEPSTWVMMILGLCSVGFVSFRKRHQERLYVDLGPNDTCRPPLAGM